MTATLINKVIKTKQMEDGKTIEESPANYYCRHALELGIRKEDLNPKGPIVYDDLEPAGFKNTKVYPSNENKDGLILRLAIKAKLDYSLKDCPEITGWRIDATYVFGISKYFGESIKDLSFIVSDCKIIMPLPSAAELELFCAPKELFYAGADYKKALDWMLDKYSK